MSWEVESTPEFDEWFLGLSDQEQEGVAVKIAALEIEGPGLGRPHVDTLKGSAFPNMKELRQSTLRIAFAFDPRRRAILLCGGQKRGQSQKRFYSGLIDQADSLLRRHLEATKEEK